MSLLAAAGFSLVLPTSAHGQVDAGRPHPAVSEAIGAVLQADAPAALLALKPARESELSPGERSFRTCMLNRWEGRADEVPPDVHDGSLSDTVLRLYRNYWRAALLDRDRIGELSRELLVTLGLALGTDSDWTAVEAAVRRRLGEDGQHTLMGQTGPLRELMIWKDQRSVTEAVSLPEGPATTQVVYLDDFVSLGWADWSTCGARGTGGWATSGAIFAVVPRYRNLDGEEFRVSFLGHETQHFEDLARFPGMAPWELEYRAKLVELVQARETRSRVIQKFLEDRREDPALPHSYANWRLLTELSQRLGLGTLANVHDVEPAVLSAAALDLLERDTARRVDRAGSPDAGSAPPE